jgi:hypothetical protein
VDNVDFRYSDGFGFKHSFFTATLSFLIQAFVSSSFSHVMWLILVKSLLTLASCFDVTIKYGGTGLLLFK